MAKPVKKPKKKKPLLVELEELTKMLDIEIRYEKTQARGGLCKMDEKFLIIVDRKTTDDYKISVIAESLQKFDISDVSISPKLREFLEAQTG